jgi:hypothetical protein
MTKNINLKKLFKNKRENLIIVFLNGQILSIKVSIILINILNLIHKPKYDFWVH